MSATRSLAPFLFLCTIAVASRGGAAQAPANAMPAARAPREAGAAFQGCAADAPLGAWISLRNDYVNIVAPSCIGSETQVVRFRLEPEPGTLLPGARAALGYRATELHYDVSTAGCFDAPETIGGDSFSVCNAEGAHVEGTASLTVENLGFATFFPLVPQLTFQYPMSLSPPFELAVRCVDRSGVASEHAPASGSVGVSISATECEYPHRDCYDYCVAPTACQLDPSNAGCYTTPDRFAVIPFEGSIVDQGRTDRGGCITPGSSEIRWRVCCGCAEAGPPPDSPASEESPCDETAADRAQLDLKMDELRARLEALQAATESYGRIEEAAAQWQDDFNQATWDCRLFGVARMLASFLLSGWSPTVAGRPLMPAPGSPGIQSTQPFEPGKAFANVVSMLEKVLDDDGSWLLPDHELDAMFGGSLEDAWDGFGIGLDLIGSSAPADLRAGLETCGAPTLNEVLDGAYEYLRLLGEIAPLAERMHTLSNSARDKDEEIFDFCLSHPRACADYARCRDGAGGPGGSALPRG